MSAMKLPKYVIRPCTHSSRKSGEERHGARSGSRARNRPGRGGGDEGDRAGLHAVHGDLADALDVLEGRDDRAVEPVG
ncbi:hypothetical protein LCE32_36465, partial [Streptomyces sp. 7G]|uniref:hypothetical protein n=1 Tax=Streptomyces sp. 7G TaxID=2877241 RepID=UPI001CD3D6F8